MLLSQQEQLFQKDVPANTIVGGVPAKIIKSIH
jgi:acetyltransferase-like isoleucine patch superfamily enzyme